MNCVELCCTCAPALDSVRIETHTHTHTRAVLWSAKCPVRWISLRAIWRKSIMSVFISFLFNAAAAVVAVACCCGCALIVQSQNVCRSIRYFFRFNSFSELIRILCAMCRCLCALWRSFDSTVSKCGRTLRQLGACGWHIQRLINSTVACNERCMEMREWIPEIDPKKLNALCRVSERMRILKKPSTSVPCAFSFDYLQIRVTCAIMTMMMMMMIGVKPCAHVLHIHGVHCNRITCVHCAQSTTHKTASNCNYCNM